MLKFNSIKFHDEFKRFQIFFRIIYFIGATDKKHTSLKPKLFSVCPRVYTLWRLYNAKNNVLISYTNYNH